MQKLADKITPLQTIYALVVSIVIGTISFINYIDNFATKQDIQRSSLEDRIQLLEIFTLHFEYKISSGDALTPIEQYQLDKFNEDIHELQDQLNEIE